MGLPETEVGTGFGPLAGMEEGCVKVAFFLLMFSLVFWLKNTMDRGAYLSRKISPLLLNEVCH